jgi:hypothetical protein
MPFKRCFGFPWMYVEFEKVLKRGLVKALVGHRKDDIF